jgi:hypothetical protein
VLHPDVAEFELLAWERLDEIIEAGYPSPAKPYLGHWPTAGREEVAVGGIAGRYGKRP